MIEDEPTTPDMIVTLGDCQIWGTCARCGKHLGTITPDVSLDFLGVRWERHVILDKCQEAKP